MENRFYRSGYVGKMVYPLVPEQSLHFDPTTVKNQIKKLSLMKLRRNKIGRPVEVKLVLILNTLSLSQS